jgi:vacuolar-type H+-ATPase subunit E/Vma4
MSLESILDHIINEANSQKSRIIQDSRYQADGIIQLARQDSSKLYQDIVDKARAAYSAQKQKLIVAARLEAKKRLLVIKQGLIDAVFEKLRAKINQDKLKKKQVLTDKTQDAPEDIDFYLNKIRVDYETDIARILFY